MRTLLAAGAALLLCAGHASAHAFLKTAEPAVGSTVQTAPSQIALTFTEGVEPKFSQIAVEGVYDQAGVNLTHGAPYALGDATHLAVGLLPLPPGTYRVTWHATAVDTHKTQGSFTFTIAE